MPPRKRSLSEANGNPSKRARQQVTETAATTRPKRFPRQPPRAVDKSTAPPPAPTSVTPKKRSRPSKGAQEDTPETKTTATGAKKNGAAAKTVADDAYGCDGRLYWLMKAEPESRLVKGVDVKFAIDDLQAATEPEPWDGVRNPVARNNIRAMKKGDLAFFYHSSCKVPGIVGLMEIVKEHTVDESAFDPTHPYYDEKSSRENPKWEVVHVEFRRKFDNILTLDTLKAHGLPGKPLENLQTLRQSRVSVSRVTPKEFDFIMSLIDPAREVEKREQEKEEKGPADTAPPAEPTVEPATELTAKKESTKTEDEVPEPVNQAQP